MRGIPLRLSLPAVALALALASGAPVPAQAPAEAPGKDVFVRTCGGCHDQSTATSRRMSETEWRAMVNRMLDLGAQATEPETEQIVAYLSKNYGL